MNVTEFDHLLEERMTKIRGTLQSKAKEYASDKDRMYNFVVAGRFLRCSPAKACLGFLTKHLISIVDMVETLEGGEVPPIELIDEKIGDAINYLILLEALLKDPVNTVNLHVRREVVKHPGIDLEGLE